MKWNFLISGGLGVRTGQFSSKKNIGKKHSKWPKMHLRQTYFSSFRGGLGVYAPKLNFSDSKLSHATILEQLADPYHAELVS